MTRTLRVLLVEDNPAEIDLAMETLAESTVPIELTVAMDGDDAMRQLLADPDPLTPDLILLDLNLPGIDGREVLAQMKTDSRLRRIPVVVLTSSDAEIDIDECYRRGANCYVTKPSDLRQFQSAMRGVVGFWAGPVTLPTSGRGLDSLE